MNKHSVEWAGAGTVSGWIPSIVQMRAQQSRKILEIYFAVVQRGFHTVSQQAEILGLSRSTAWAVTQARYKGSGLSAVVIGQILNSPRLPQTVRVLVEEYVYEKLLGAYGHSKASRRLFRTRLGLLLKPTGSP